MWNWGHSQVILADLKYVPSLILMDLYADTAPVCVCLSEGQILRLLLTSDTYKCQPDFAKFNAVSPGNDAPMIE